MQPWPMKPCSGYSLQRPEKARVPAQKRVSIEGLADDIPMSVIPMRGSRAVFDRLHMHLQRPQAVATSPTTKPPSIITSTRQYCYTGGRSWQGLKPVDCHHWRCVCQEASGKSTCMCRCICKSLPELNVYLGSWSCSCGQGYRYNPADGGACVPNDARLLSFVCFVSSLQPHLLRHSEDSSSARRITGSTCWISGCPAEFGQTQHLLLQKCWHSFLGRGSLRSPY